jgi:hypothetical protein
MLRPHRIRSAAGALRFINRLGFCYAFTAGPGGLPGLFDVLDTRSVDRMWSWAWEWKDVLASGRQVHYGKVIRRKPAYISLEMLPSFYALSGNVGEADDHLQAYREGRLSALAKAVYEQILADAPLSTWALRRRFVARGESGARFHRALDDLQEKFLVAKVGEESEWRNGFIWNAFHRWMPHVVKSAAGLRSDRAAAAVLERYLVAVGVAGADDIAALFGWTANSIARAAEHAGVHTIQFRGQPAWATPGLVRGAPVSAEG